MILVFVPLMSMRSRLRVGTKKSCSLQFAESENVLPAGSAKRTTFRSPPVSPTTALSRNDVSGRR
jgi:hypothetical protein